MNNDTELVIFLRDLASRIEDGRASEEDHLAIGEFYISEKFRKSEEKEYSKEEMIKYLCLGWYIYNHLLTSSCPNINET